MKNKESQALTTFRSGSNCAQAVLSSFTKDLGVDSDLALKLTTGFGAGMGRLQETCGAATGAFMVLGLHSAQKNISDEKAKEKTIDLIQAFDKEFKQIHGTINCKLLLNCNLKTEEGQKHYQDKKLSNSVCEKCVQNAVSIVQELIEI